MVSSRSKSRYPTRRLGCPSRERTSPGCPIRARRLTIRARKFHLLGPSFALFECVRRYTRAARKLPTLAKRTNVNGEEKRGNDGGQHLHVGRGARCRVFLSNSRRDNIRSVGRLSRRDIYLWCPGTRVPGGNLTWFAERGAILFGGETTQSIAFARSSLVENDAFSRVHLDVRWKSR